MKRSFAAIICIFMLAALSITGIFGCGGSASDKTEAAGSKAETSETSGAITKASGGDEFRVGDTFLTGDMKVVYVCSGEYYSDNQFIQPKEGYHYIYLKLHCENTGKTDESLTSFDFECYADGYSMDQLYLDDSLSASLSSGRTSDGFLYFEVPEDAVDIQVEHSVSLFGNEKFSLIYEGELYSDFVAETNSSASENAYSVGQTAEGDLSITFVNCYPFSNEFLQPKEGYRYIAFEFEVENTSSSDQNISYLSFQCYADGVKCDGCFVRDDNLSATLSSGKKAAGTVSFEVPEGASVIEAEYEDNIWTSSKIIFLYNE